jgi:hypothetical protein
MALFSDARSAVEQRKAQDHASSSEERKLLQGVVAYVRARTRDGLDSSEHLARRLRSLGAEVCNAVGSRVTHVVFHGPDGDLRLIMERSRRGRQPGVPLPFFVAVSWVQACSDEHRRALEHSHALARAYDASMHASAPPAESPSRLTPVIRTPGSAAKNSARDNAGCTPSSTSHPSASTPPASAPNTSSLEWQQGVHVHSHDERPEAELQADEEAVCIDSGGKHTIAKQEEERTRAQREHEKGQEKALQRGTVGVVRKRKSKQSGSGEVLKMMRQASSPRG